MATIKVSIELDDASLQREIREAAATTKREFDKLDAGSNLQKKAKTAFDQIGQDARSATRKMQSDLETFSKRGFFKTLQDNAKTAFTAIANGAKSTFSAIGGIASNALGVFGGNVLTNLASKITSLGTTAFKSGILANAGLEQTRDALKAVTGSAEVAERQIAKIKKLADATPFAFPDLAQAALSLQGFGLTAEEVEKNLVGVADAAARSAAVNKTSYQEALNSVVITLGQIAQTEKLVTQDIRQLTTRGLPVLNLLAEEAKKDVLSFTKDIQEGVSGPLAARALLQSFRRSEQVAGFAERQGKTFLGRISTLEDALDTATAKATEGAFNKLKDTLDKTIALLTGEGGIKFAESLKPIFEKPVELMNKALDALTSGNISGFIKDTAADALKEIFNTVKEGMLFLAEPLKAFLKTAVIDPLVTGISASVTTAIDEIKKQIKADAGKLPGGVTAPVQSPEDFLSFKDERALLEWFKKKFGFEPGTGGVFRQVKPQAFQQVKPQAQPQTSQLPPISKQTYKDWDKAIRDYQKELEQQGVDAATKRATESLNKFLKDRGLPTIGEPGNLPILPNLPFGLSPAIPFEIPIPTLAGAMGGGRGQLIIEQTEAVEEQNKAIQTSTAIVGKSSEQWVDYSKTLLLAGETAKNVFDFGLRGSFEGMVSSVIGGSASIAAAVGNAFSQIKSRLADFVGLKLGNIVFGTPGTGPGGSGGSGGIFGGLFGGGGAGGSGGGGGAGATIANLIGGGGGGGAGGAGSGIFGAIKKLFSGGGAKTAIPGALPIVGSGVIAGLGLGSGPILGSGVIAGLGLKAGGAAGGFSLAGVGGALAGLAPAFGALGGSLVGGPSLAGQIIGGVGGAALGIGGALLTGATTFGLSASAIAFLTNPFTLIAGGALLLGAYFLGKSKQRKSDEQAADAIWSDELNRTRELVAAVNSDRMDGGEALAAWATMRAQTVSQLNQIKTKSVRESRLKNQLRDLDNGVVTELRNAANRQARRKGLSGSFLPEFAGGGFVPGIDRGTDSVMIAARPGEVILNRTQQGALKAIAGRGILQHIGVPGFEKGGAVPAMPPPLAQGAIRINLAFEGETSEILGNIVVKGANTSGGQRAIVNVIKTGRRNGDL